MHIQFRPTLARRCAAAARPLRPNSRRNCRGLLLSARGSDKAGAVRKRVYGPCALRELCERRRRLCRAGYDGGVMGGARNIVQAEGMILMALPGMCAGAVFFFFLVE